jgi:integrase
MQNGSIIKHGKWWMLRYYERTQDGRRQVAKKLAQVGPEFPDKHSVKHLTHEVLAPINGKMTRPMSVDTVEHFLENVYLPHCDEVLRPSTANGYRGTYNMLKPYLDGDRQLREVRTSDVERWLRDLAKKKKLAHTSYRNMKNFLSGAFRYAKRTDAITENPARDVVIPRGKPAGATHAYTLDEIQAMLAVLGEPARTVVLTFALTGLRLSELKGLKWEDIVDDEIRVSRSVWSGKVSETKTLSSHAAVPMLSIVADALRDHRARETGDGYIFHGRSGQPLRMENILRREMLDAFDEAKIEWQGWHAFRRGLATNLYALGAPDKTIQAILRHANVSTTMAYYVRPVPGASHAAMDKLANAFRQSEKKVKTA